MAGFPAACEQAQPDTFGPRRAHRKTRGAFPNPRAERDHAISER
ncbi:hypothetical protein NSU_2657 [Novosphingobium pentaromativorans US6-1]|uniref:Uncharacterized protein n=1 Tax=Novosphingobium pentaromativorans US6-1 TaxID=1088721 RepID=G6EE85_9SPHN|nr:hypothetical protein NSU_2657 [Novosphingobium pentaromativorans US6-1]